MRLPNWFDKVIEQSMGTDAQAIAYALARNPEFIAAIQRGIDNKTTMPVMGLSPAQHVADAIKAELNKE